MESLVYLIKGGYPLLLIGILLLLAVPNRYREQARETLATMNILLALAVLSVLLITIYEFFFLESASFSFINRALGPYWFAYWLMLLTTILVPQLFWLKRFRKSIVLSLLAAFLPLYERFVIIITSFHRDYLHSGWLMAISPLEAMLRKAVLLLLLVLLIRFVVFSVRTARLKE